MMNRPPPRISKWIFVLADLLILAVFAWMVRYFLPPKTTGDYVVVLTLSGFWAYGAYICILPWLIEFKAQTRQVENDALLDAMEQLKRLEDIGARVQTATATWQTAQDSAVRVTQVAADIEQKIKADMKDFMEFAERVNNEEKNHLRLEVEKLRRNEGDWLQVAARLLDHTFALNQAGHRSGQGNVIAQLDGFQTACRDVVRRIGLISFTPAIGDPFDARGHQTEKPDSEVQTGSVVTEVLATGYTYQGQLLRRALVRVAVPEPPKLETAPSQEGAAEPQPVAPAEEIQAPSEAAAETGPEPTPESSAEPNVETLTESGGEAISEAVTALEVQEVVESVHEEDAQLEAEEHLEPAALETVASPGEPPAGAVNADASGEFTLVAHQSEESGEPRPRRRARKVDPQTSLPF